jgi:hypothetical protein
MSAALAQLPERLQGRVQSELKPGESATWAGQPDPNRFMRTGFLAWLFFIPWTAFALFWMAGASGFRIPDFSQGFGFFPLFGLPFLLVGVGGLSAPFWLRRKARNIVYVITPQRAFSIEGARSITVRTFKPEELRNIVRKEHPDGSGDLVLATTQWRDSDGDARQKQHGFFAIAEVRRVEQLLQRVASPSTL